MKSLVPKPSTATTCSRGLLRRAMAVAACPDPRSRSFSVLNRPPPNYPGHIPLTMIERAGLTIGSGIISFLDPRRGGMHYYSFFSVVRSYEED